jgi:hypothetical protein
MIKIPSLTEWVNTKNHAINDAKLIIPVYESADELKPANKLLLFKLTEAGDIVFTDDQLEGDNYFGGGYDSTNNNYQFRISFYIQDLLHGDTDYGLVLLVSGKTTNANEVSLYGTEPVESGMRLSIVYTKID